MRKARGEGGLGLVSEPVNKIYNFLNSLLTGTYYIGFFEVAGKKINIVPIDKPAKDFSTSLRFYTHNQIISMSGGNRIEIFSIK